jgi:uncharacterized iron-regulated protein
MTSHVLYADEAHNAKVSVDQSAKLTPATPVTSSTSVIRQFLDLVKAVYADPAAASQQNHPWLNAVIKSHMSNRAHRLMHTDY